MKIKAISVAILIYIVFAVCVYADYQLDEDMNGLQGNIYNVSHFNGSNAYITGNTTSGTDFCIIGGNCLSDAGTGDISAVNTPGPYIYGGSTSGVVNLYLNRTPLDLLYLSIDYTHLGNFTDDLGDRGYTSLDNFTNDPEFINDTFGNATYILQSEEGNLNVNSSGYWDDMDTTSSLNNAITLQGENITGGTIAFARLPTLTDTHTHKANNITAGEFLGNFSFNDRVGIGDSTPDAKLDISYSDEETTYPWDSTGFYLENTNASNNTLNAINFLKNGQLGNSIGFQHKNSAATAEADFFIWTHDGSGGSEKFRIKGNGNIGIGTITPTTTLDVNGTIRATEFNGDINASNIKNFDIAGTNNYYFANIINMSDESVTYVDGSSLFLKEDGDTVDENSTYDWANSNHTDINLIEARLFNGVYHVSQMAEAGTGTSADPYLGWQDNLQAILNLNNVAVVFDHGNYSCNKTFIDGQYKYCFKNYNDTDIGGEGEVWITQEDGLNLTAFIVNDGIVDGDHTYNVNIHDLNFYGNTGGVHYDSSNGTAMAMALYRAHNYHIYNIYQEDFGNYATVTINSMDSRIENIHCRDSIFTGGWNYGNCIFMTDPSTVNNFIDHIHGENVANVVVLEDYPTYTNIGMISGQNNTAAVLAVIDSQHVTVDNIIGQDVLRGFSMSQNSSDVVIGNIIVNGAQGNEAFYLNYPYEDSRVSVANMHLMNMPRGITLYNASNVTIQHVRYDNVTTKITEGGSRTVDNHIWEEDELVRGSMILSNGTLSITAGNLSVAKDNIYIGDGVTIGNRALIIDGTNDSQKSIAFKDEGAYSWQIVEPQNSDLFGFYNTGWAFIIDTNGNGNVSGNWKATNINATGDVCITGGNCLSSVGSGTVGGSGSAGYLSKWTTGSEIGNSIIYDNGSYVGIGTDSPRSKLDVNGELTLRGAGAGAGQVIYDADSSSGSFLFRGSTNGRSLKIQSASGGAVFTSDADTSEGFLFAGDTGGDWMKIDSSGNVGIGTTSPDQKLKVSGNINVTGDINYGGALNSYSPLMMGADHDRGYTTQCWVNEEGGYTLVWFNQSGFQSEYDSLYCNEQAIKKAYYQEVKDIIIEDTGVARLIDYGDIEEVDGSWRIKTNLKIISDGSMQVGEIVAETPAMNKTGEVI